MTSKQTFLPTFVFLVIFLSFGSHNKFYAQKTFNGDKELKTQDDIIFFGSIGYTTITGTLIISKGSGRSITDLTPLSSITSVGEKLWIDQTTALTSLSGLNNLTSIGGKLYIYGNTALTSLSGLNNLTSIGGEFYISGNTALTNLDGLSSLTSIGGDFSIGGTALTSLSGLNNLTSIGGDFSIGFTALTSLTGLSSLTSIGGSLSIGGHYKAMNGLIIYLENPLLTNLDGLSSLTSVDGVLEISGNVSLNNLNGLNNITSVEKDLIISKNESLTNLDGLSSITSVGGNFVLGLYEYDSYRTFRPCCRGNAKLTNLDGLSSMISVGGYLVIDYNEMLTNLDGLSSLTSVGEDILVKGNDALISFCGLYTLLSSNGLNDSDYSVENNAVNPTIQEIKDFGPCSTTDIDKTGLHYQFKLSQNYPNPFNPITYIKYELQKPSNVNIIVYNSLGKKISTLVNKHNAAGEYEIEFDGSNLSSGIYFYKIIANGFIDTKKLMLLK